MPLYEKLSHPAALIVFLLTLSLPILIGFLTFRRTKNQSDFLVGGRAMNKIIVALSAVSSGRSSWLVLGVSGTTKHGIFAGMISGTLVTIFWKLFLKDSTGIYELIPAFLCSAIMVVGVSLLTQKRTYKEKKK